MRPTADVRSFARALVFHHAIYDRLGGYYTLNIKDVPDFDIHKLASLIMSSDESYASEATGPDNPAYEKIMLPALQRYLCHSTDRDEEIEFNKAWRDGVTSYFLEQIQTILDEQCNTYLHDTFNDAEFYAKKKPDNGEIYFSRYA